MEPFSKVPNSPKKLDGEHSLQVSCKLAKGKWRYDYFCTLMLNIDIVKLNDQEIRYASDFNSKQPPKKKLPLLIYY